MIIAFVPRTIPLLNCSNVFHTYMEHVEVWLNAKDDIFVPNTEVDLSGRGGTLPRQFQEFSCLLMLLLLFLSRRIKIIKPQDERRRTKVLCLSIGLMDLNCWADVGP